MGLPGHRRTSSHKHRRAAHFALVKPAMATDKKTGAKHISHRAAPGALEYNGIAIHVKGRERKLQKLVAKTKSKATAAKADAHDHDHSGPHEGHDHS